MSTFDWETQVELMKQLRVGELGLRNVTVWPLPWDKNSTSDNEEEVNSSTFLPTFLIFLYVEVNDVKLHTYIVRWSGTLAKVQSQILDSHDHTSFYSFVDFCHFFPHYSPPPPLPLSHTSRRTLKTAHQRKNVPWFYCNQHCATVLDVCVNSFLTWTAEISKQRDVHFSLLITAKNKIVHRNKSGLLRFRDY